MSFEEVTIKDKVFWDYWNVLIKNASYHHALYSKTGVILLKDYNESKGPFTDLSIIFVEQGVPLVGILMTINNSGSSKILSCYGHGLFYKENQHLSDARLVKARKTIKKYIQNVLAIEGITEVYHRDYDSVDGCASAIGRYLLDKGAQATVVFIQLIDMTQEIKFIYSQFSKSCRNNINRSLKQNFFYTLTEENIEWQQMERLKKLHFLAAGRQTRSDKTWVDLFNMVKAGQAFLIEAVRSEECIASALFFKVDTTAVYAISASDRRYFDDPINHGIMWLAIQFAKELGCTFFELGSLTYSTNSRAVSPKDFSINRFKKNFGGRTMFQLETQLLLSLEPLKS